MNAKRTWLKATALASILGLSLGITTPAEASIVDPAVLFTGGNPITCTATAGNTLGLGYDGGLKVDGSPTSNSYNVVVGGNIVGTVTVTPSAGGLDWTSTYPISAVIMKGSDKANLYPYVEPPASGSFPGVNWAARTYTGSVTADTDLNFPAGASHFEFCYQNDEQIIPPPPEITKTAETSWIQYHNWTLDKSATPTWITMFNGDSHEADYVLHAEKSAYGVFTVSGVIEVTDPSHTYIVDSVADAIVFTGHAPIAMSTSCAAVDDGSDVVYRCTYSQSWSSQTGSGFEYLAGGGGGQNSATAVVHYPGESNIDIGPTTAPFTFSAAPDASYGDSLVVDDTFDEGDHTFTDTGDFNYTLTFSCPDDNGNHPNDVTGTFSTGENTNGEVISSAYVDVGCVDVTVEKTAQTSFDADYSWTGDKKIVVRPEDLTKEEKSTYCSLISDASDPFVGNYVCDDITLILNEGSVYDTVYQLNATRSAANESGAKVFGTITVSWPTMSNPTFTGDPTDTLHFSDGQLPATQGAVVSNCVRDDVNLYITCDYSADLTSTRDGFNTASIVRQNLCYDAAGAEIACPAPAGTSGYTSDNVNFAFGDATTSTDECVSLSDLFNAGGLNSGPTFSWTVDGNVCDSTTQYVSDDVDPTAGVKDLTIHADWAPTGFEEDACVFQVPNVLNLSTNDTHTLGSNGALISVNVPSVCNQGCTLTQGYWKTHSKYGPAPYDSTWAVIGEDTLFFHSGYTWMNLFKTPPKGGNAYIQLAHQYMAARLNVEAGASTPASVATALASATALFNAAGSVNSLTSAQITQARQLAGILGSYNEGAVGPGHCSESPTRKLTANFLK